MKEQEQLCLTKEEAEYLDQIIGKLPTSFGIFFVDFFRVVQKRLDAEKQVAEEVDID